MKTVKDVADTLSRLHISLSRIDEEFGEGDANIIATRSGIYVDVNKLYSIMDIVKDVCFELHQVALDTHMIAEILRKSSDGAPDSI